MLAMDVNDDAGCLNARDASEFLTSILAPTLGQDFIRLPARAAAHPAGLAHLARSAVHWAYRDQAGQECRLPC